MGLLNLLHCSLTNGYLHIKINIFLTTKMIYELTDAFLKKSMKFCVIFFFAGIVKGKLVQI